MLSRQRRIRHLLSLYNLLASCLDKRMAAFAQPYNMLAYTSHCRRDFCLPPKYTEQMMHEIWRDCYFGKAGADTFNPKKMLCNDMIYILSNIKCRSSQWFPVCSPNGTSRGDFHIEAQNWGTQTSDGELNKKLISTLTKFRNHSSKPQSLMNMRILRELKRKRGGLRKSSCKCDTPHQRLWPLNQKEIYWTMHKTKEEALSLK